MENMVTVNFTETAKAYEVLADLKSFNASLKVLSAGVVENKDGVLTTKDGFSRGSNSSNWATGGLIGGLIGILGGPLGILFGGCIGMMLGNLSDIDAMDDETDTFKSIEEEIKLNDRVLLILIQEDDPQFLNNYLWKNGAKDISRESLEAIQQKLSMAEQAQEDLADEAKKKMRAQKKEDVKDKVQTRIDSIKEKFSKL